MRKAGKSTLRLNFEELAVQAAYGTAQALQSYVESCLESAKEKLYVFLDEVQLVSRWNIACCSLRLKNVSIFVTGSNAKLLAREFTRELSGRYVAFRVYPFVYQELSEYARQLGSSYTVGGLSAPRVK